jgi:hypothetical protein
MRYGCQSHDSPISAGVEFQQGLVLFDALLGPTPKGRMEGPANLMGQNWANFGPNLGQKAKRPLGVGVYSS